MPDFRRDIVALLPRLRRLAWAISRSDQEVDDLLQLTVERALARSDGWLPGTRLDLWMFRIMKNIWIDEIRTRNRWGRLVERLPEADQIGDEGAAADALLDAGELMRVKDLVEGLPDEQSVAVKLVLLGEHSYAEAAAILEIPEGTLTSRLARGRAALLRHYQGRGATH